MEVIILGGGLAGISLAYFLNRSSIIIEKESHVGGLCRSFEFKGVMHDIGPHIFFSKDDEVVDIIANMITTKTLRRSNKILYKGRMVKYPFENDLAALDDDEKDYCVKELLHNPYENYTSDNLLQFFLKTFGEGITRLYLQPYNEKIWKFDPSFIDTQMIERIPRPPIADIIKSSKGIPTEGYTHQLYFQYPVEGGVQSLINAFIEKISHKSKIMNSVTLKEIRKKKDVWVVETDKGTFPSHYLINCMPLHELFTFIQAPKIVRKALEELKYNSLYLFTIHTKNDAISDNFAFYIPDRDVIFHRVSKLDFLGDAYRRTDGSTLLVEITYRPGSYLSQVEPEQVKERVLEDLDKVGLVRRQDVVDVRFMCFKYAYVIYDLCHRKNIEIILNYLAKIGITCCGRFAEYQYLNMDATIRHAMELAKKINSE
jgi:protoporphyrinogen oxidase